MAAVAVTWPDAERETWHIARDVCESLLESVDEEPTGPIAWPRERQDMTQRDAGPPSSSVSNRMQRQKQSQKQCQHFPDCKYGNKCCYEHPRASARARTVRRPAPQRRPARRPEAKESRRWTSNWTTSDVHKWVLARDFPRKVADQFHHHDIDGKELTDLDLAQLKDMGIESLGQRKKLVSEIRKLGQSPSAMWEDVGRMRRGTRAADRG